MDDSQIILLLQQRDPDGLQHLTKKYGPYCRAIAANILSSSEDVEECINDAFFQVWNAIPPTLPDNLGAFVGKVTRNCAFNRHRDNRAAKRGGGNLLPIMEEMGQIVSGALSPDDIYAAKELSAAINAFLETLPPWKRYIMVRRYWYSDPVQMIAKTCHRSESYVSMTLTRLRRKLSTYLKERGFDL